MTAWSVLAKASMDFRTVCLFWLMALTLLKRGTCVDTGETPDATISHGAVDDAPSGAAPVRRQAASRRSMYA